MAGRINDRELITLARISTTPEENRWGWFRGFKMERGEGGEEGVLEDLEEI